MQPTIEDKEAVLKMAGVLIRKEPSRLWVAQPPELQPLTIAKSRVSCINKAYNRYILRSKSWRS